MMFRRKAYVPQSVFVLKSIGKVILFVAVVVSLTSCSRAQASRAAKQKEVKIRKTWQQTIL